MVVGFMCSKNGELKPWFVDLVLLQYMKRKGLEDGVLRYEDAATRLLRQLREFFGAGRWIFSARRKMKAWSFAMMLLY